MNIFAAPIEIFRAAMPLVGADPPDSIDDQTPEAVVARAGYEGIVANALTAFSWSWATKNQALTRDAETGVSPEFSYPLPVDTLEPRFVQLDTAEFDAFVMRENKLLTDTDTTDLTLFYTFRVPETEWPGDFAWGIVYLLAAYISRGLLARTTAADNLEAQGQNKINQARARDRSQNPGPPRDPNPILVAAWRGGSRVGRTPEWRWP